jgi:hypothetical protein
MVLIRVQSYLDLPYFTSLQSKFWSYVRELIWEKAQELNQMEQAQTMEGDFKGVTARRREFREGGYFYEAELTVLKTFGGKRKAGQIRKSRQQYLPSVRFLKANHRIIQFLGKSFCKPQIVPYLPSRFASHFLSCSVNNA